MLPVSSSACSGFIIVFAGVCNFFNPASKFGILFVLILTQT